MSMCDILTVLFRHKAKILLVFGLFTTVISGGTFLLTPVYEAKASLLVKLWKEDSSRLGVGTGNSGLNLTFSQDELANTEIQVLTSRELAEKVITSLTLKQIYPDLAVKTTRNLSPMAAAVESFGNSLKVTGVRKSNVISISFQHNDPKIAARAVNLLVEAFKEKILPCTATHNPRSLDYNLRRFRTSLETQRGLCKSFNKTTEFSLKQRTDLDTSFKTAHNNISEMRNKIGAIKGQMTHISKNNSRYTSYR
jgi:capsular polysaccharide biosynthesis protein